MIARNTAFFFALRKKCGILPSIAKQPHRKSSADEALVDVAERLCNELQLLNATLDDLQVDIQWAARNIVGHLSRHDIPSEDVTREPVTNRHSDASLILRDLLACPELRQADLSEATQNVIQRGLEAIAPGMSKALPTDDATTATPETEAQEQEPARTGRLF